jgi:predicted CopG family antitoxin
MKTITLTEEAYGRLLEWKSVPKESFSAVVLKLVPKKGTLGQMINDMKDLPRLTDKQAKVMEQASAWGREPTTQKDKWTS